MALIAVKTNAADAATQIFNTEVLCAHIRGERDEQFSWTTYVIDGVTMPVSWDKMSIREAVREMHRAIRRLSPDQDCRVTMELIPKGSSLHELEFNLYTSSYGGPSFSLYSFGDFGLRPERRFELLVQRR